MMSYAEKKAKLIENGITELDLDELIHAYMSMDATNINNSGMDAQLTHLFSVRGLTVDQIIEEVES